VEAGVQLVASALARDTAASVILFGTETTIEEGSHRKALLDMSIPEKRIITKACPQLQSYIEQNPKGEETEMLISLYLNEALEQIPASGGAVYLSLNCSHFGYSEELWKRAFAATSYQLGAVLDPNSLMGDFLTEGKSKNRFSGTEVTFHVVSKVKLLNEAAMVQIFSTKSPELAKALGSYELIPGLFGK
jgi:glutamate racemase